MGHGETKIEKVRGWKVIAAVLEVDVKTAMKFATPGRVNRLSVRRDHIGIYVRADVLAAWITAEDQEWTPVPNSGLRHAS